VRKPAPADADIHPLIRERWSQRAFSGEPIEPATLRTLFEAARWAPSSFNDQPWRFLVATREDAAGFGAFLDCLTPSNQRWNAAAGALVLACARVDFERTGKPNRHAFHDTGIAIGFLLLQATALGIASHPMAGFDVEKARSAAVVPAPFEPLTMIALAMPGDLERLPEDLRARELAPRARRPLPASVFGSRWGTPASFIPAEAGEGGST
jgi:nitroreductase